MTAHKNVRTLTDKQFWFVFGLAQDNEWEAAEQIIKLLVSNLRSNFRKSLRNQVNQWLETPEEERKFDSPLSPRQWAILNPRRF